MFLPIGLTRDKTKEATSQEKNLCGRLVGTLHKIGVDQVL